MRRSHGARGISVPDEISFRYKVTPQIMREALGRLTSFLTEQSESNASRRWPKWLFGVLVYLTIFIVSLLAFAALDHLDWDAQIRPIVIAMIGTCGLVALIAAIYGRYVTARSIADMMQTKVIQAGSFIKITEAVIEVDTDGATSCIPWRLIDHVESLKSGVLIRYGGYGLPLPEEAFPAGLSKDDMLATLRTWHMRAQGTHEGEAS